MAFLEVKNLKKKFGNTSVLHGIDFSMNKGEVIAVLGSSGGGKTTFLRCLNFLERPNEGTIDIEGAFHFDASQKYSDAQIRSMGLKMGLVFQSFNLFPQYTALKNVLLPLDLRTKEEIKSKYPFGIERKKALAQVHEENLEKAKSILAEVGLAEKMNNYPCQLSGGQQQRVAIARALVMQPDILCFDEPTSALDPELTGEVIRVIKELRDKGHTMIIVTHEMEFARNVSDMVVFFADGVIEEIAPPEEFFGNPKSEKTIAFLRHTTEMF